MKNIQQQTKAEIPAAVLKQAAIWQARLQNCDPHSAEQQQLTAQLNTWLLANPQHQQAYAEMNQLWQLLAVPAKQLVQPATIHVAKQSSWPRLATAACLLLSLLAGIGWQQQWPLALQSDYRTNVGEQQQLQLADSSQIKLNTNSAIAVDYSASERRVRLLQGEAWFDVMTDATRPFIVETPRGTITVTGTQFNVKNTAEQVVVSLVEGGVRLANQASAEQILQAGEQALLAASGISRAQSFDQTAVSAWRRGQWVFYQTPLQQVVAELNRHRSGKIVIINKQLNQQQVSGVFSTQDPDAALRLITQTLQLQQTRLSDYLILLH